VDRRGGVRVEGRHYRVAGAKRGPAPAHDIGIWVGAYRPRMLRLIGRLADGWLPSLPYLSGGPAELAEMNAHIDAAAAAAGRDPRAIRRLLNVAAPDPLTGSPHQWAHQLADIALQYGISGLIHMRDDPRALEWFAREVAPAVRELVAAGRERRSPASPQA